jgi:hypothetical protein
MLQVRPESDALYPSRLQVKDGSFRDLPLTTELSDSLGGVVRFPGERQRRAAAAGWGVNFAGSALVSPGRDAAPFCNKAFNVRIKLACQRGASAGYFRATPAAYGRYAPSQRARSQPARRGGAPGP